MKARQRLDKYRIEKLIARGGFASVYRARDTVEGVPVALKIPSQGVVGPGELEIFRKEVQLTARLDHPNILPIKNAGFVGGRFVIVYPLGIESLAERMRRRISLKAVLDYAEQMLQALGHAHGQHIIHCDVKPENLILFPGGRLRLADFGIARFTLRTMRASGSGTLGYMAPEQAMGKPSFRSDVFAAALVIYRMLSGLLPEWPFTWPPEGFQKVRRKVSPRMLELIRRAMEVDPRKRHRDAVQLLQAFTRARTETLARRGGGARSGARSSSRRTSTSRNWRDIRTKEFLKNYGRLLDTGARCSRCDHPVSEPMVTCPWCGVRRNRYSGPSRFPARCSRCRRGVKLDWRFCPWCYGPGREKVSTRRYRDKRYVQARCSNPSCTRRQLMPFMRYCPWCRRKVRTRWRIEGSRSTCPRCSWGVLPDYWSFCPWCGRNLHRR